MTMTTNHTLRAVSAVWIAVMAMLVASCGGGTGSDPGAALPGSNTGQAQAASAGNNAEGPDLSNLSEIVLGKINQDPMRKEMKITGKLVEFNVKSAKTQVLEGMGASSVVDCAGVVVFDGDVEWNWQASGPKKAGEPAKFECSVEYANQGQGWQIFGPMGIYPL